MSQATPVIGSAEGGTAEAVEHERTGLLVPPGDGEALAAAMLRLVLEPDLRHALGRAAFTAASARLNARVQSAALENLLLEVAS
jgi:glycosyltransferase involved in cell wall biosynthesis